MRLTVLGSSAGGPSRVNPGSGYLVEGDGTAMWLDAGPGTFMRLAALTDPGLLDGVVISHTHVDHCSDLLALYAYMAYGPSGPGPIPVWAPVGTRDHMAAFVRADEGHVLHDVLEFHEVVPGEEAVRAGYSMRFGEAIHPVPAVVTRMSTGGATLVYSGDTGPGGDLIELATGAGMLLCEAGLQEARDDETYPYHLTAREAGEIAAMAGVFDLVVTHVPSRLDPQLSVDQAASAFAGSVSYASPGTTFEIPRTE